MTLRVELVDQPEALAGLARDWNAALAGSHGASPFLCHEWLSGAWPFLSPGRSLFVLLLRDGARLVGALPLLLETQRWRRLPVRRLGLMTDPITACVRSDAFVTGDPAAAAAALGDFLRRERHRWDVLELDSLPGDGLLATQFDRFAAALGNAPAAPRPHWRLQRLTIAGSWDDYLARLGGHGRERMRREIRHLERAGQAVVEFVSEAAAVSAALEDFFALERRSGKQGRDNYTPLDDRLRDYYRRQFLGLAAAGRTQFAVLRLDGAVVGSIVGVRFGRSLTTLNDMFDPQLARLRPGHYLRGAVVRHCHDSGIETLDFNGHGHHFERWLSDGFDCLRAFAFSPSARGALLRLGHERLLPTLRRRLPWMRAAHRPAGSAASRGLTSTTEDD